MATIKIDYEKPHINGIENRYSVDTQEIVFDLADQKKIKREMKSALSF